MRFLWSAGARRDERGNVTHHRSPIGIQMPLRGSFRVLIMCDVADSILLDRLRPLVGVAPERSPNFVHPTPEYVRFERPPVVEAVPSIEIDPGRRVEGKVKYFEYGVVSVELELQFDLEWPALVEQSARWMSGPGIEDCAIKIIRERLKLVAPTLEKPYASQLTEDYYIVHVREALDTDGKPAKAAELLAQHGGEIAQIVRGELTALADSERQEILQYGISYYPTTCSFPAGRPPLSTIQRKALRPRSSCSNTPTRSSLNSAITTPC
jgi:hypothetical protein